MKKRICAYLLLFSLLFCLTACTITKSGWLAGDATSTPKVEEMMNAFAEKDMAEAKSLMHSQVSEGCENVLAQLMEYLDGRKTTALKQTNISVSTTSGENEQRLEHVSYQATLADGTIIYVNSRYLSNDGGNGFITFYFIVGVV
ncbi:MAG: hypothetical protein IKA72_03065 [Clostridia bacterium]|nr:hypothetical protein [Clostridia bacterium]